MQYLNTGGEYRHDKPYLKTTAQRIDHLRKTCHSLGLNFYVEIHVDRVTEDLSALRTLLRRTEADFELNGDLSHLLYRGIVKGQAVDVALAHVGHMHQRMAREYGDLSINVLDPAADWKAGGPTYQAWALSKRALGNGLSSRTICGEAGPIHLVKDALTQDARMVPLLRIMAEYADRAVAEPANPFEAKPE